MTANASNTLDLLSTSQTNSFERSEKDMPTDLGLEIFCHNNAPYFAIETSEQTFSLWQGNCNDWTCPRCGQLRAKAEYGRIVEGCRTLAKDNEIYFITLTCRGKELSLEDAEENYLKWTNKLLTALRTNASRKGKPWHYVQVTERQKRGHPHSHVLTTFYPDDIRTGQKDNWQTIDGKRVNNPVDCLRSDWLEKRCISAGLGSQYDISKVETVEGASRYVAKYLFKDSMFDTRWQKNWRRVRYSQSFPKLPKKQAKATALISNEDWIALSKQAKVVNVYSDADYKKAYHNLVIRPIFPVMVKQREKAQLITNN